MSKRKSNKGFDGIQRREWSETRPETGFDVMDLHKGGYGNTNLVFENGRIHQKCSNPMVRNHARSSFTTRSCKEVGRVWYRLPQSDLS
jgi:hypothetical protein